MTTGHCWTACAWFRWPNLSSYAENRPTSVLTSVLRYAMLKGMARRSTVEVPVDIRARLEAARLDLLTLFRALD